MAVVIDIETKADSAKRDLDSLNKSLAKLVTSSNNSNKALGNISAGSFKNINKALDTSKTSFQSFEKAGTKSFANIGVSATKTTSSVSSLRNTIISLSAAFLGMKGVSVFNKAADSLTNMQNRLKMVVSSSDELVRVQQKLFTLSKETRTTMLSSVQVYSDFAIAGEKFGMTQSKILTLTKTVNQAAALSGSSAEATNAALTQLSQGLSSGSLAGDELRSVMEQLPYLGRGIAKQFGMTAGQLKKFASEGTLGPKAVMDAINQMSVSTQADFDKTAATSEQAFRRLAMSFNYMLGELNKIMGVADTFARKLMKMADAIDLFNSNFQDASLIFTQNVKNYIRQFDIFSAASLTFQALTKFEITPPELIDKYQTFKKIKSFISTYRGFFTTIEDLKKQRPVGYVPRVDANGAEIQDPGMIAALKERQTLVSALNSSIRITMKNIMGMAPVMRGAVASATSVIAQVLRNRRAEITALIYETLNPLNRGLESVVERISLWTKSDSALSRSWVNLFKSKNILEFRKNLEELNAQRQLFNFADKAVGVSKLKDAFRGITSPIHDAMVSVGILNNQLIRIEETKLANIITYFKDIGRVVNRVYKDVFATTLEPIFVKTMGAVRIEILAVADALSDTFNTSTGKALANSITGGFSGITSAFKSLITYFKLQGNPVKSLFENVDINTITDKLATTLGSVGNFIESFFKTIGSSIANSALGDAFANLKAKITSGFSDLENYLVQMNGIISDKVSSFKLKYDLTFDHTVFESTLRYFIDLFERIQDVADDKLDGVESRISSFATKVKGYFFDIYDKVVVGHSYWPDTIDKVNEYTKNIFSSETVIDKFKTIVINIFKALFSEIQRLGNQIGGVFGTFVNKLSEVNISDVFKTLGEKSGATFLAGLLLSFGDAKFKFIAISYFVSLVDESFAGVVTTLSPQFGKLFGTISSELAKSAVDGILVIFSTLQEAVPSFISGLLDSFGPFTSLLRSILGQFLIFQNSLLHGIVIIGAAWALLTKKGGTAISDLLFGKLNKKTKIKTEGIVDYIVSAFKGPSSQKIGMSFFDAAFSSKKMAVAAAAIFSTALLDSITLIEAAQIGVPLLAFAIMGKDGGKKILKEALVLSATFSSIFKGLFLRITGLEGFTKTILKSFLPTKSDTQSAFVRAGADVFDSFKQMIINLRSNSNQFAKGKFSFVDAMMNTRDKITPGSLRPVTRQTKLTPVTAQLGKVTRIPLLEQLKSFKDEFKLTQAGKELFDSFEKLSSSSKSGFENLRKVFDVGFKGVGKISKVSLELLSIIFTNIGLSFKSLYSNAKIGFSGVIQLVSKNYKTLLILVTTLFSGLASANSGIGAVFSGLADNLITGTAAIAVIITSLATLGYSLRLFRTFKAEGFTGALDQIRNSFSWLGPLGERISGFIKNRFFSKGFWVDIGNTIETHFTFSSKLKANWNGFMTDMELFRRSLINTLLLSRQTSGVFANLGVALKAIKVAVGGIGLGVLEGGLLSLWTALELGFKSLTLYPALFKTAFNLKSQEGMWSKFVKQLTFSPQLLYTVKELGSDFGELFSIMKRPRLTDLIYGPIVLLNIAFLTLSASAIFLFQNLKLIVIGSVAATKGIIGLTKAGYASAIANSVIVDGLKVLVKGFTAIIGGAVSVTTGITKLLAGVLIPLLSTFWTVLSRFVLLPAAIGAVGLFLFGPGNSFVDRLEWAYDKIRSIFGMSAKTKFGRMSELLQETKPVMLGNSVADIQGAISNVDTAKQTDLQFTVLKEASDAAMSGLKDLQTLYIKQGYVSEGMLHEWETVVENFKRVASHQPQLEDQKPKSLQVLSQDLLKVEISSWALTKAMLGIDPVLGEQTRKWHGLRDVASSGISTVGTLLTSIGNFFSGMLTIIEVSLTAGFIGSLFNKVNATLIARSAPLITGMARMMMGAEALALADAAALAARLAPALLLPEAGIIALVAGLATLAYMMGPLIADFGSFIARITGLTWAFNTVAKALFDIDNASDKFAKSIESFWDKVINAFTSRFAKLMANPGILLENFFKRFEKFIDKASQVTSGKSLKQRKEEATFSISQQYMGRDPRLQEMSSKLSKTTIGDTAQYLKDPNLKKFAEDAVNTYREAFKKFKIFDEGYDPLVTNRAAAISAEDWANKRAQAYKELKVATNDILSIDKNLGPIAAADKEIKAFSESFSVLGDEMKSVLDIDMGVGFKDFQGAASDIEIFRDAILKVEAIDRQLDLTFTFADKGALQIEKATIKKQISDMVAFGKGTAERYGTIELTLKTQAELIGSADFKDAIAGLRTYDQDAYKTFTEVTKLIERDIEAQKAIRPELDLNSAAYNAYTKNIETNRKRAIAPLPKDNWVDALNAKLQKLNLTAISVDAFAYFSESDTKSFNSQLDIIVQKEKDLAILRSERKPFEEQIKALKEIFTLQQNVSTGLEAASNKALASVVNDVGSNLRSKLAQYEKLTGEAVPTTVKAKGESQQYMEYKSQIKDLETAGKSGQLTPELAAQQTYLLEEAISKLGVITKLTLSSIVSSFGDLGLSLDNLGFSRLSSESQSFLAGVSSQLQAIEKVVSESAFSAEVSDLLKTQETLLLSAADTLLNASYKTGTGIASALGRFGLSENKSIANLNKLQIDNLLELDKAAEKARILASRASNPEDYLKKVKDQARATIRGTQEAERMANSFEKKISNFNEVFKTSLDGFDATTMSPQIISSAMDIARELKNELEIAIAENKPTADLFERLRSAELAGGFITLFKDLGNGLRDALVGGAESGFDKIKSAYSDSQMTFKQYAGLDPSRRRQRAQEATYQESFKKAANMELSPEQATMLDRIGSGEDISKVMKEFESAFSYLFKSDNPVVISQDNLKKSIDDLKKSIDIDKKEKQIMADISSGKISEKAGIGQLNDFVADANKSTDSKPVPIIKNKGVGNLSEKTLSMAKEASSKRKEFEDLGSLLSKANFKGVLGVADGFGKETVNLATNAQLKQAAEIKVKLAGLQAEMADATLNKLDTQTLQKKIDDYTDELGRIPYAIDYLRNAVREAGVNMRDTVDSTFRAAFTDLLKGKATEGQSAFQTFTTSIMDNITGSIVDTFAKGITDKVTGPGSLIASATQSMGEGIYGLFGGVTGGMNKNNVPSLLDKAGPDTQWTTDMWTSLKGGAESVFGGDGFIMKSLSTLGKGAMDIFSSVGDFFTKGGGSDIGGSIMKLFAATGGQITGSGTGTSDSIPAMLSNGEFVVNAKATKENLKLLHSINSGNIPKFASGGMISNLPSFSLNTPTDLNMSKINNKKTSNSQVINLTITGDISRQTKAEVYRMLPDIAQGVNIHNREKGYKG